MIDYKQTAARLASEPLAIDSRHRSTFARGPAALGELLANLIARPGSQLGDDHILRIAVFGVLTPNHYADLREEIQSADDDPDVRAILLNLDSPGGSVHELFELTETLRSVRRKKPIVAVANHHATSAAFAIAASCGRVVVTQTAAIGSVGVLAVHVETSEMDRKLGVKFTPVFAGQRKNDLSPDEPLSDRARADLQREVDRIYSLLCEDVGRGRGISADRVRATEAQTYYGERAVAAGLADGIGTLQTATQSLRDSITSGHPVGRLAASTAPSFDDIRKSLAKRGRLQGSRLR